MTTAIPSVMQCNPLDYLPSLTILATHRAIPIKSIPSPDQIFLENAFVFAQVRANDGVNIQFFYQDL